ncbi:Crp/Fnr family transcriptional regulator [Asaia lannensis]|uniref:Crp/Fnr family transcriptional regulator n=1 Tax=Asaia lannensis NBRC 102526 TaxID=1307926 RepID=A0ABT1CCG1_9PROT|nr:Crp/Fnr family transcriptional regulator [Asaia lannensis]MCO6158546.1 Crp/Fnr family transcriptional regulator [Asaia lannensis NBRC 102526]
MSSIMEEMSNLNPWFASINEETRSFICENARLIHVGKGEALFRSGETIPYVAMIRTGALWAERASPEGRNYVQAVMGPGFFGHFEWVFGNSKSRYDVRAVVDTEVFVIPAPVIKEALNTSRQFTDKYMELMATSHSLLEEYSFVISVYDKTQRLAWILSMIADGHRGLSHRIINIPVTQLQIAENMGLTRQTINKSMQYLAEQGIVQIGKSNVTILDVERLKDICHFDTLN